MRFFLPLFAIIFLICSPAQAHRPYAVFQKTITAPNGEYLIVEKLYGDGILVSDPVKLQIRNKQGTVIAYSPVQQNISSFCFSVKTCFFATEDFILPRLWRLNPENLDFEKKENIELNNSKEKHDGKSEQDRFKDYIDLKSKTVNSSGLGYPEMDEKRHETSGFERLSFIFAPVALVLRLIDNLLAMGVIFCLCYLPFAIFAAGLKLASKIKDKMWKSLFDCFTALILFSYSLGLLASLFLSSLITGMPFEPIIVAIYLAVYSGRKKVQKLPAGIKV